VGGADQLVKKLMEKFPEMVKDVFDEIRGSQK
jgi:hypothetical protein